MPSSDLKWSLDEVAGRLSAEQPFATVFDRGDDISVELYAPVGSDGQQPHDRDELYIVASGSGTFSRAGEVVRFGPGDLLYVPAHVEHRFESFSDDFRVWVVFYGAVREAGEGA